MTAEERGQLDRVEKVDLSNEVQVDTLHRIYCYNMEVVNHWLGTLVLPTETMQYPHRHGLITLSPYHTSPLLDFSAKLERFL